MPPRNELDDTMATRPERRKALKTALIVVVLFGAGLFTQEYVLKRDAPPTETQLQELEARYARERDSLNRLMHTRPDSLEAIRPRPRPVPPMPLE